MNELKHLLEPVLVRGKRYKNRITCAPSGAIGNVFPDGTINLHEVEELAVKSRGGFASVTVGETPIDEKYAKKIKSFAATDFTRLEGPQFEGWKKVLRYAKAGGENLALVQLFHVGDSRRRGDGYTEAYGPHGFVTEDGVQVHEIDLDMMHLIADHFAQAAFYLKTVGFDGIMLHGGHGWLISQFLSARTNHRTDEFGGSIENRCRFPAAIVQAIRERVGDDFLIEVRISADEHLPGGMEAGEVTRFCQMIDGIADIINVSAGCYRDSTMTRTYSNSFDPHFVNLEQAAYIKRHTKHLLINLVGGINNPEEADRLIGAGLIDMISLGRQAVCDVEFANKCAAGRSDDIDRCARCMGCMGGQDAPSRSEAHPMGERMKQRANKDGLAMAGPPKYVCPVHSMQNVRKDLSAYPAHPKAKRVLVVGGGPGGLQAAITAAERGHQVTLCEKAPALGGLMRYTDIDPFKADLQYKKDQLIRQAKEAGVQLLLNTHGDAALIQRVQPEAIIAAVGATSVSPTVPGHERTVDILDVYGLNGTPAELGHRVVVIGGGETGCEAAIYLGAQGKQVVLLSRSEKLVKRLGGGARSVLTEQLQKYGVDCRCSATVSAVDEDGVFYTDANGSERFVIADSVVAAIGTTANKAALHDLEEAAGDIPVLAIGDCVKARKMGNALGEGIEAAYEI